MTTKQLLESGAARRAMLGACAALSLGWLPLLASAQGASPASYPNKPIKFVVPYSAGGFPDTVARICAQRLTERLGQSVALGTMAW